ITALRCLDCAKLRCADFVYFFTTTWRFFPTFDKPLARMRSGVANSKALNKNASLIAYRELI
ncbi:MAG TPA: hypothetical protein VF146_14950, partial [Bryobacteraceae bacterium]